VYVSQVGAFIMAGTTLHAKPADGSGQDEVLLDSKNLSTGQVSITWPQWTPDNRYLIYKLQSGPSGASVWALPNSPGAKPLPVVKPESSTATVVYMRISPDGHWLAYSFNDGSREEVYVTSFPGGGGRWQISRAGGSEPIWRHDGKEIFYLSLDGHLLATQVQPHEKSFDVGNTETLFEMRYTNPLGSAFDVAPDGRFMVLAQPEGSVQPMELVLNWNADLK
jgi:Tol biopolymer transport system component